MAALQTYTGRIGPYDATQEDFVSYCDRMELFYVANGLASTEEGVTAQKEGNIPY